MWADRVAQESYYQMTISSQADFANSSISDIQKATHKSTANYNMVDLTSTVASQLKTYWSGRKTYVRTASRRWGSDEI